MIYRDEFVTTQGVAPWPLKTGKANAIAAIAGAIVQTDNIVAFVFSGTSKINSGNANNDNGTEQ